MTFSALTTRIARTSDRSSRGGVRIDSIGHHHVAGTSLEAALSRFQPGGGEVSPNYCIMGKDIVGVVDEEDRAWTSASAQDDARSITYEIVNSTGGPDWRFDPDTIASVIALDADICRRYGIVPRHAISGFWEHKNLSQWFGRSYPTACAGPSFDISHVINSTLGALAGVAGLPEGVLDIMSLSNIVADPRNGVLHVMDTQTGVRTVAEFVSTDMDNSTVVGSLNDAFGKYHTPKSAWGFDVLKAIVERHADDYQNDLAEKVAAKLRPVA